MANATGTSDRLRHEVIMLTFADRTEHAVLENASLEEIAGRVFVVGRVPDGVVKGFDSQTTAVAWDQVDQFFLLPNMDAYWAAVRKWRTRDRRGPFFAWLRPA